MLKRFGAILLALALVLALCPMASATDVTLPSGWSGEFNDAGDYIVTIPDDLYDEDGLLLIWAEFDEVDPDTGEKPICALEGYFENNAEDVPQFVPEKRKLPATCVSGSFTLDYQFFAPEDMTPAGIGLTAKPEAENTYLISSELELLKLMAVGSLLLENYPFFGTDISYELTGDIVFHTPLGMEIGYRNGEYTTSVNNGADGGQIAISMLGYGYRCSDGVSWKTFNQTSPQVPNPFFHGVFDGGGHCISGLHTIPDEPRPVIELGAVALFGYSDGTIKNLTVKTTDRGISGSRNCMAVLLACGKNAIIDSCKVIGHITNTYTYQTGHITNSYNGLIFGGNLASIKNCIAEGTVSVSVVYDDTATFSYSVGGLAGSIAKGSSLQNCTNYAVVSATVSGSGTANSSFGGLVGIVGGDPKYCANYGDLTVTDNSTSTASGKATKVGGMAGTILTSNKSVYVYGCYTVGEVNVNGTAATDIKAGSFAGSLDGSQRSGKAYLKAIFAKNSLQQFAGQINANKIETADCYIRGNRTGEQSSDALATTVMDEDFKSSAYDLAGKLNDAIEAIEENSEMVFALVDDADYPTLIERPAPQVIDLVAANAVDVQAPANVAADINVSGQVQNGVATVSVDYTKACVVLYTTDNGASYHRMTLQRGEAHSFTVDYQEGMQFVVAVKGDVSGDGDMDVSDVLAILDAYVTPGTFDALHMILGDVDGDGTMDVTDVLAILDAYVGTGLAW